jgi:hypothetical protein
LHDTPSIYVVLSLELYLNIYTAPGFFSALVAGINLLLFLFAFKDIRIAVPTRRSVSGKYAVTCECKDVWH